MVEPFTGRPPILECVTRFDSDLLVIGANQKSAGGEWITGATTEQLMRTASVPVLVIPALGT